MICIDYPCQNCAHFLGKINSWQCGCDAFPDGIPSEIIVKTDVKKLKECNNGIKYEPKDKK